ncbi:hypothetical protein PC112_g20145, partial [Phytophthora cactorum]
MGGTESNEVTKDDARLQQQQQAKKPASKKPEVKQPKAKQPKAKQRKATQPEATTTAKDGSTTVVSTAVDGTMTSVTTSADGCTVTTVVTRPDVSSETTTEIVTTTETEVDVTQQETSPTAAAAARAVADFESVSEETSAQSLTELAWHAWSASATAAAMGVKEATAETLRALSESSGVFFTSTVVAPQTDTRVASLEAGGEWKKEDFKKLLPAFLTYVTDHGRRFETLTAVELFIFARAFCRFRVLKHQVDQEKEKQKSMAERVLAVAGRRSKERKLAWELTRAFTLFYPEFPILRRGLRFSKTNAVLMDEAHVESESSFEFISINRRLSKWLHKVIVISLLRDASEDYTCAKNVIVLHDGEVVRSGSWGEIIKYVQELGVQCPPRKDVAMCLGDKKATAALFDPLEAAVKSTKIFRLADEVVLLAGSPIVEDTAESDCYLMNVSSFSKMQAVSSSKQAEASDKRRAGAFMYEFDSDGSFSDSDDEGFDAGEWLMSWFQPQSESPPLTTKAAARKLVANWAAKKSQKPSSPNETVKTEVFRSEEADGSIVTKTVRTTTRTETSPAGELVTTIEVETTTETQTKGGAKSTSVETETTTETATETTATSSSLASTAGMTAISSTEEAGDVPGETVKTEVFRSEEADGSIVTKTVRTTTRTETSPAGELVTTIEVETTTETQTKGGAKSTSVETETTTETATETTATSSSLASTAGMTAISSTEEAGDVPGETVKTEVFRSEEADGSIVTKTVRTTTRTETSPAGELVTTIEVETTTETEVPVEAKTEASSASKTAAEEPNWFMSLFKSKETEKPRPVGDKLEDSSRVKKEVENSTVVKTVAAKPTITKQASATTLKMADVTPSQKIVQEIKEETVEETKVTERKKPKSKKNRKPKRKPTAGTTEAETTETTETTEVTEVTEVTTETVEVTEEVPATTEETTEVTEVTTETIEVTDVKPEE